jgi:FkbM family methyltransferase
LLGKGCEASVQRGGCRWHLDLREGIDFSIWLLGSFEPRTIALYRRLVRPGSVVLDVGANIGAHTIPLAGLVGADGRVHAFEASEWAFDKMSRNLAINPELVSRVTANHCFLTDGTSAQVYAREIYSSWPLDARDALHPEHRGELKSIGGAVRTTLDQYAGEQQLKRVDLIKIDVDGNELSVLEGGSRSIGKWRPPMVIELAPYICTEAGHEFDVLIGRLRDLGYRQVEVIGKRRRFPLEASDLERVIPTGASINALLTT